MNRERRDVLKTTVRSGMLLLELMSEQEPNYLGRTHYIQYPDRSGVKSLPGQREMEAVEELLPEGS